jgi:hypothetical protein
MDRELAQPVQRVMVGRPLRAGPAFDGEYGRRQQVEVENLARYRRASDGRVAEGEKLEPVGRSASAFNIQVEAQLRPVRQQRNVQAPQVNAERCPTAEA